MAKKGNSKKIKFSETDEKLKQMILRRGGLSEKRIKTYNQVFWEIYELTNLTPKEIIDIAKDEEKPFITPNGGFDILDINDRKITKIQYKYLNFLQEKRIKERPLAERTKQLKMEAFRSFLKEFEIQLPKPIRFKVSKKRVRDDEIPTWNDVQKAMTMAKSPRDKGIISLAATSGLRVSDIVSLRIIDLIDSCGIYFEDDEDKTLKNLLKKNPDNIIPCWDLIPRKTEESGNLTMTFNTPETTNHLFDYLKYRLSKIEEKEKKKDKDKKIDVYELIDDKEPLFISQRRGFLNPESVGAHFSEINGRMGGEKDRNGIYGKFRIHNLRSLFQSTCRRSLSEVVIQSNKTFEGDVVNLFTGHMTKDNPLNYTYESVPLDDKDNYVRKAYESIIDYLSIQPIDVKDFKTEDYQEWEKEKDAMVQQIKVQNSNHQRDLDEKDKEIAELKKQLENQGKQLNENSEVLTQIKNRTDKEYIRKTIQNHFRNNQRKKILNESSNSDDAMKFVIIETLAYEYALEEDFDESEESINKYINKAIIRCNLHPELVDEMIENGTSYDREMTENRHINILFDNFCEYIKTHGDIWEMVDDKSKLKSIFFKYMRASNYDTSEITDDDMNKISEDVMMEYIQ